MLASKVALSGSCSFPSDGSVNGLGGRKASKYSSLGPPQVYMAARAGCHITSEEERMGLISERCTMVRRGTRAQTYPRKENGQHCNSAKDVNFLES